jgi:tetratricopeptide (TPR) repeat protein
VSESLDAFLACRYDDALAAAASEGERGWITAAIAGARGQLEAAIEPARLAFEDPDWRTPAALTLGSVLRQLHRYGEAEAIDEAALATASTPMDRANLLVSYAADAVGVADPARCFRRLELAVTLCDAADDRLRVRHAWVATEFSLLIDDPDAAVTHARRALSRSNAMPRHRAKSELFLGVALASAGDKQRAIESLGRAADLARSVGAAHIADIANQQSRATAASP